MYTFRMILTIRSQYYPTWYSQIGLSNWCKIFSVR